MLIFFPYIIQMFRPKYLLPKYFIFNYVIVSLTFTTLCFIFPPCICPFLLSTWNFSLILSYLEEKMNFKISQVYCFLHNNSRDTVFLRWQLKFIWKLQFFTLMNLFVHSSWFVLFIWLKFIFSQGHTPFCSRKKTYSLDISSSVCVCVIGQRL